MAWGRWGQTRSMRAPGAGRMGTSANLRYQYLLRDDFTDPVAAGSLTGTMATDGVNVRTVPADTALRASTTGGKLYFNNGADYNNPGVYYPMLGRYPGLTLVGVVDKPAAGGECMFGFSEVVSGQPGNNYGHLFYSKAGDILSKADSGGVSAITYVANASVPASYKYALTQRRKGAFLFLNVGTTWKLVMRSIASMRHLRPALIGYNSKPYFDTFRVGSGFMPTPVASDGFTGSWPITDGLGHREGQAGEIGSGGSGKAWTDQAGTWGSANGVASAAALAGGIAIATIDASTPDIDASMRVTALTGKVGFVFRYVDAQNYAYAIYNGAGLTIRKVVAGVDSEVTAPVAMTWANGSIAVLHVDGTSVRLMWSTFSASDIWTAMVSGTIDDAALQASGKTGFLVDNTATTIDVFDVYANGSEGQYAGLDNYLTANWETAPAQVYKNLLYFGDSKTVGSGDESRCNGYPAYMTTLKTICNEVPTRIATGGATVASRKSTIDADLTAATGTPDYILWNLGANDATSLPVEATWKADAQYMINAFRAKWASTPIYFMRVWRSGYTANYNTINGWYTDLVAANPGACFLGPDERTFLPSLPTHNNDGTHPMAIGYRVTAEQWRTTLGFE